MASTVLIHAEAVGLLSQGTGVVVAREGGDATILTCAHVIPDGATAVTVNGFKVLRAAERATDIGIDLALLVVPGLDLPAVSLGPLPRAGEEDGHQFFYAGYSHLHGKTHIKENVFYRIVDRNHLHVAGMTQSCEGCIIEAVGPAQGETDVVARIQPGHSGAALLASGGKAVGVFAFKLQSQGGTDRSVAISIADAAAKWPALRKIYEAQLSGVPSGEPVKDDDDPNKGAFGGLSERSSYRLSATLLEQSVRKGYFVCDLMVERLDRREISGAVTFVLHPTFSPREIIVKSSAGPAVALKEMLSYGVFTVGCIVEDHGKQVKLEYDLANLPDLQAFFKTR